MEADSLRFQNNPKNTNSGFMKVETSNFISQPPSRIAKNTASTHKTCIFTAFSNDFLEWTAKSSTKPFKKSL